MDMKSEGGPSSLLVIILLLSSILMIGSTDRIDGDEPENPEGYIDIEGDQDLLDQAASKGWKGSGNESDPFRIENLSIDFNEDSMGLNINGTESHLRIENCTFTESTSLAVNEDWIPVAMVIKGSGNIEIRNCTIDSVEGIPMYIIGSTDVIIRNCRFYSEINDQIVYMNGVERCFFSNTTLESNMNSSGIVVSDGRDLIIENCSLNNLSYGLISYSVYGMIIAYNTLDSFNRSGIRIIYCEDMIIMNNTISVGDEVYDGFHDHLVGISIQGLERSKIEYNIIESGSGMEIYSASDLSIRGNEVITEGICAEMYDIGRADFLENEFSGKGLFYSNCRDGNKFINNSLNGGSIFFRSGKDLEGERIPRDTKQVILDSVINAEIKDLNTDDVDFPVIIERSSYVNITDCSFSNSQAGVFAWATDNVSVKSTRIEPSIMGIQFYDVSDSLTEDCHVEGTLQAQVIFEGDRNRIMDNRMKSDGTGIRVDDSQGSVISDNTIESPTPIRIDGKVSISITNNELRGGRIAFDPVDDLSFIENPVGNTQDGMPIYYFFDDLDPSMISGNGSFYLFHNIKEKVISDLSVKCEVTFENCKDLVIMNSSFQGKDGGLRFDNCEGIEIRNIEIVGIEEGSGLSIDRSIRISVSDSNMKESRTGIELNQSGNVIISDCNISDNEYHGIRLLNLSNGNTITSCWIGRNRGNGIDIISSDQNTIRSNEVFANKDYGVSIRHSFQCLILSNHFVNNNGIYEGIEEGRSQAYSMHQENYFYINDPETTVGNYWSDLSISGTDENGDGFIDRAYFIESEEENEDSFPSVKRFDQVEKEDRYRPGGDDWLIIGLTSIPVVFILVALLFTIPISFWRRK